ncbi:unnamed protein product [Withania somnifera]
MKWHRTGRRRGRPHTKELSSFNITSDNEEEDEDQEEEALHLHMRNEKLLIGDKRLDRDSRRSLKGMSPGIGSESFLKRPKYDMLGIRTPRSLLQASGKQVKVYSNKKSHREVTSSICKFFYHAGVPPHAASSPYFQKMLKMVGQYGEGLVGPSSRVLSGQFLQDEVISIRNRLSEYKASWAVTGCSILADSWLDTHGRTLINVLVSCPRGMYFVCSVDATNVVEDAKCIFNLLDKVIEEMGAENVVQVITQNTPNYQAAGKMLEEKRRNLFWTPCAAYCIDRILEDFVKIKWVRECMEKGQKITKFIYNRFWLLSLMKKEFTAGQELLKPSLTLYSSTFATVQSLLGHRNGLKRMFQSNKWLSSRYSKLEDGKEVEKIVLNATFWRKMQYVWKSVDPILEVFQKINSNESHSIPFIYNNIDQAKLAIRTNHNDDEDKYQNFLDIIDSNWNSLSHHPLYLAAHFLNPSYRYRPDFVPHPGVVRGLNACIVRLEPDDARRISASMQISDFNSAKADFGTDLAISTRVELNPAAWWQQHGINCLELQRIAVRILSQTCSSFGCAHSWSVYDQIHSQRHNRVAKKRLSDVTYVHYNLRLRDRQISKMPSDPIFLDSVLQESLLYDWIVEPEKPALQEDEEILFGEMELEEYENDFTEHDSGNAGSRKGSLELVNLAGEAEPLEVDPDNIGTATDDDYDPNFLDKELSE